MSTLPEHLDEWVRAAQEGDKEAFGLIYDHFFEAIFRYVYFRVKSEDVEDLVGTIFVKSWMHLPKYEKRDVSFQAWLFRIAHNTVIDHRRTHRAIATIDPETQDMSVEAAPESQTHRTLISRQVRDEIQQLKEPFRQVVTLKFLSGLSNAEIAEIMGEREGNVRVIQFRALQELKKRLTEKGFKPEFL